MHIYKFRMLIEENDNFIRDIEIQANQTFEDFHKMIVECVNLNGNELASFFICDQKWNKLQEITLIDMMEGAGQDEEDVNPDEKYVMNESLIRDFINEPHQRLLYEYDFLDLKTFFIELLSVFRKKDDDPFPRCSLSRGNIQEEEIPDDFEEDNEELRNQLLDDFDEMLGGRFDDTGEFSGGSSSKDPEE